MGASHMLNNQMVVKDMEKALTLDFSLEKENFDAAGEASSKIKRILQRIGIRADVVRKIAIAAYEAEMNVIIHSEGGSIKTLIYSDRTEIYVEDDGPGIPDVSLAMQEGYSTAPDYVREMGFGAGMGLPNMRRCSTHFKINSIVGVGTKIKMTIVY